MRSNPLVFLIIAVAMFSQVSHAGREIGNGGDAVVCRDVDGKIDSAELLDFYEARTRRSIGLSLSTQGDTVRSRVELVLSRLERISAVFVERHRQEILAIVTDLETFERNP